MFKCVVVFGLLFNLFFGVSLSAEEAKGSSDQPAAKKENLNDLLALRARLMIEANKLDSEIRKAVNDKNLTSPAIEALRKKVEDLQREIITTYSQIREEVEKLPEIKEKRTAIAQKEKQIEELTKKIDANVQ
jgi:predicted  nucleic acid-binding Zn-ribbon protein